MKTCAIVVLSAALMAPLPPFGVRLSATEKQKEPDKAAAAAIPAAQIPGRRELMRNKKVIVSTTEVAAGGTVPMHRHERDYVTVVLTDGTLRETVADQGAMKSGGKKMGRMFGAMHVPGATGDKVQAGEVVYNHAGYTHADENKGKTAMRAVTVEFLQTAGKQEDASRKSNKYCNAEPSAVSHQSSGTAKAKACVDEKYLFCTQTFCVEDVTIDPGAISTKHSHATDHMLVAVTDYQLTDTIVGKGQKVRARKAGEIEYIPAGITHQLTNSGTAPARFVVVAFQ